MLDFAYAAFFSVVLLFFLLSKRKEVPFLLLVFVVLEYFLAQLFWLEGMSPRMSGLLLVFLLISSMTLLWARSLNYSKEQQQARMLFRVSGWLLLLAVVIVIGVKGAFLMPIPAGGTGMEGSVGWTLQPFVKLAGNGLLFILFLQLILGWGRPWSMGASLADLAPTFLYIGVVLYLVSVWPNSHASFVFFPGVGSTCSWCYFYG